MIVGKEKRLGARALAGAAAGILCGTVLLTDALAGGRIGGTGFGGARIGAPGVGAGGYGGLGSRPAPSSVIRHGGTGYSIYSQRGITRVIGDPGVSRNVRLPDGRTARIVGDGRGGATIHAPGATHRIFGNPRFPVRD